MSVTCAVPALRSMLHIQNIAADAVKVASFDLAIKVAPYSAFALPILKKMCMRVKMQTLHQHSGFKYFPPLCD